MGLSRREFLKDVGLVGLGSLLGMYNFAKANAFSLKSLLGGKEEYKIPYSPDVYEEVIENLERFYKNGVVREGEFKGHKFFTNYNQWRESIERAEKNNLFYAYGWFHPGSPSEVSKIWWEFIKENKVPYGDKLDPYIIADEDEWTGKKYLVPLLRDKHTPTRLAYEEPIFLYLTPQGYKGKHFPEIVGISPDVFRGALPSIIFSEDFEDLEKAGKYPKEVNPFYVFLFEAHDPEDEETEKIKRIDVGFDMPPERVFYRKNGTIEDISLILPMFSLEVEYKKNKEQPEIMFYVKGDKYPVDDPHIGGIFFLVPKR